MKASNLSIGVRLAAGIALILAISTTATGFALWTVKRNMLEFRDMAEVQVERDRQIQEWTGRINLNLMRTLAVASSGEAHVKALFEPAIREQADAISGLQKKIEVSATRVEEKSLLAEISALRARYRNARDEVFALHNAGRKAEADKLLDAVMRPAAERYLAAMQSLVAWQKREIDSRNAQIQQDGAGTVNMLILLTICALAASLVVGWLITRGITGPLRDAVGIAQKVAAGDLRSRIEVNRKDETGALLGAIAGMQEDLRQIIGKVQVDVGTVSASATELAVSASELADSSAHQSDAVSSNAASIEELTVSIAQVSESAQLASGVVEETLRVSEHGVARGHKVSAGISAIDHAVTDFGTRMEGLRGQALNVGVVVKLIREIAEQTNLLALNAAIEAARAGEQGRGFAVVADEVRKLAERTSTATREIQQIVEGIQNNVVDAGGSLDDVKSRVRAGVVAIDELVAPLKDLREQAVRATEGLNELSNATREQKQVSEQIARNTEKIANAAEQNHAAIAQSRDTAAQLQVTAGRLLDSTARFQLA